jgi:CheY-like chemotaxis protein
MMGGQIGMESVEGKGSIFWFTAVLEKQSPNAQVAEEPTADIRGKRILVVDDNATNRQLLAAILSSWGCRHEEAADAETALHSLHAAAREGDPFRMALVDMRMPGMNGQALGEAIKTDPALRQTILIMMTSLGERGDAKRLENIGFSAYLTKPIKQSQLHDCLATVLDGDENRPAQTQRRIVTRHSISDARRRQVRILVAEDNPTNQKVALKTLEKLGYRADAVPNGREAVTALQQVAYDLVLMDCQMPEMDGYAATRAIRSADSAVSNPNVPIIAMTAHAMEGDRERCLEAGMNDYVAKPVDPQALAEAVETGLTNGNKTHRSDPKAEEGEAEHGPADPGASDRDVFDRSALLERLMGDEELAADILAGFLDDAPQQIGVLREAVDHGDAQRVAGQAHTLKGAAGNIGAFALQQAAAALEAAGKENDLAAARTALQAAVQALDALTEAFASDEQPQAPLTQRTPPCES